MPDSVADHYPELMHYTTATGLAGIVTSGCLWATHAAFLNDSQEIQHFLDEGLPHLVKVSLETMNAENRNDFQMDSNAFSDHMTRITKRAIDFYLFSLCGILDERVSKHGVLSQWRGYGTDGGYAIVFDTVELEKRLTEDTRCRTYLHEVIYSDTDEAYRNLAKTITDGLPKVFLEPRQEVFEAITTLAACHKHGGFAEEREVRLVNLCPSNEIAATFTKTDPLRFPSPKTFVRGGVPVPYLELFADRPDGSKHLPIKRVIVGPHRDQTLRIDAVRRLLAANGYAHVEVHGSASPYLGR